MIVLVVEAVLVVALVVMVSTSAPQMTDVGYNWGVNVTGLPG